MESQQLSQNNKNIIFINYTQNHIGLLGAHSKVHFLVQVLVPEIATL